MTQALTIYPLPGLPEVLPGDDLAALLLGAVASQDLTLQSGDVIVVAQKVVSKAEGSRAVLTDITPRKWAHRWAERWSKDARQVELVLRESRRVVRAERGILVCETWHGFVCANAGVDLSNSGAHDVAVLLPEDPDRSAALLRASLAERTGCTVGIIVADSFGRPWRNGLTQVALGVAGVTPAADLRGQVDTEGRPMHVTVIALADELASAADLVCGKTTRIPGALIRGAPGVAMTADAQVGSGKDLLRPPEQDLFR
jgi:coenzyme F420-0:L-glutamate ligase / coenzyme F420-1:gamma-L-glutamate ligase